MEGTLWQSCGVEDGRGGTLCRYSYDDDEDHHEEKKQQQFSSSANGRVSDAERDRRRTWTELFSGAAATACSISKERKIWNWQQTT